MPMMETVETRNEGGTVEVQNRNHRRAYEVGDIAPGFDDPHRAAIEAFQAARLCPQGRAIEVVHYATPPASHEPTPRLWVIVPRPEVWEVRR